MDKKSPSNKIVKKPAASASANHVAPKASQVSPELSVDSFPALREFLRGYLHEDWQDEHESPEEAAQQFCDDASPEERRNVAQEWHAFRQLTKNLSLPAISAALNGPLGAAWSPKTTEPLEAISAIFRPFVRKM